jgi:hypothetical protein
MKVRAGWMGLALLLPAAIANASVGLQIDSGIVVETSGGVKAAIDGDLTETGTGYFKGTIESGARSGMTTFAGLTLSSGLTGSVTRVTGTAYAGSHGEGTNLKRYYEISNTSGSDLTADMSAAFVGSGANDEQNGLSGPYFIYRYTASWTGYGSGVSATPITAAGAVIPTGSSVWVLSEGVRLAVKSLLQGPYSTSAHAMTTALAGSIPTTSPYSEDARTVTSVPAGVTDWALVQVRATASGAIVGSRSCFLKANGMLLADDGSSEFVGVRSMPADYFLVIRHRNHLKVMTAAIMTGLTWGSTPSTYDFSSGTGQYYGGDAKLLETGAYGSYAGDTNASGTVDAADRSAAWNNRNKTGYQAADVNLSGTVDAADRSATWNNRNKTTSVP